MVAEGKSLENADTKDPQEEGIAVQPQGSGGLIIADHILLKQPEDRRLDEIFQKPSQLLLEKILNSLRFVLARSSPQLFGSKPIIN